MFLPVEACYEFLYSATLKNANSLKCFKQESILSKVLAQESLIHLIILIHSTIGLKLSPLFRSPLAQLSALEYTPENFILLNFKRYLIQSKTPVTPPSHFTAGNGTGLEGPAVVQFLVTLNIGTRGFTSVTIEA